MFRGQSTHHQEVNLDLLLMCGLRSKYVEEFNFMQFMWMNKKFVYQVGNNKKVMIDFLLRQPFKT